MGKTIVSDFKTYAQASEVVRNLELEGITGTEVEVVSDAKAEVKFDRPKTRETFIFVDKDPVLNRNATPIGLRLSL